jgi:RAB protein geranylgeranyltransferase component A
MYCLGTGLTAEEGMERVRRFAASVGRYSNTPFLATVFGTAELAQAFCRCVYSAWKKGGGLDLRMTS